MKFLKYTTSFVMLILTLNSCDNSDENVSTIEAEQMAKLSGTWKVTEVALDDVLQPGYSAFMIKLSPSSHAAHVQDYVITNNPERSPWLMPFNGRLSLNPGDPTSGLIREDGVAIAYEVTGSTLLMTFTFAESDSEGRSGSVSGDWRFALERFEP